MTSFDDYEQLPSARLSITLFAGACAGIMEHIVMYPVDTIKTRMQSLSHSSNSISGVMREMVRQEGFFRPLRGASAVVIGAGPAHALYFSSYEFTKEALAKMKINGNLSYVISAASATLIHDAISNPTEVIKQRLQMYDSPYKTVVECARKVYQHEGFKAFYRSYTTQLVMNVPYHAIHFSTYEFFQEILNKERKYSPMVHVVAGGAAGATAAAFTTPLDVCKTLLNTQEEGVGMTRGLFDAIRKVYRVAGMAGFFKGIQARVLYQMPATAVCWSTYEFFKFFLHGREEANNRIKSTATPVVTIAPIPPATSSNTSPLPFDDNKLTKPLQYVLQKDSREMPAMSSVGIVYAHNQTLRPSATEYSEYKRNSSSSSRY